MRTLRNYEDSKCCYGYMSICEDCLPKAPKHVDITKELQEWYPGDTCEICGRKGVVHNE